MHLFSSGAMLRLFVEIIRHKLLKCNALSKYNLRNNQLQGRLHEEYTQYDYGFAGSPRVDRISARRNVWASAINDFLMVQKTIDSDYPISF